MAYFIYPSIFFLETTHARSPTGRAWRDSYTLMRPTSATIGFLVRPLPSTISTTRPPQSPQSTPQSTPQILHTIYTLSTNFPQPVLQIFHTPPQHLKYLTIRRNRIRKFFCNFFSKLLAQVKKEKLISKRREEPFLKLYLCLSHSGRRFIACFSSCCYCLRGFS